MRVKSSMIKTVVYNKKDKSLVVGFRNGSYYQYDDVPKTPVTRMLKAKSKGRSFLRNVRGKYDTTKLEGPANAKKTRK